MFRNGHNSAMATAMTARSLTGWFCVDFPTGFETRDATVFKLPDPFVFRFHKDYN